MIEVFKFKWRVAQKIFFHWIMTSEKTIYLILDEVALMLYTFQSEDVFSVKINSFSEKSHKHFSLKTQKNSA